MTLIEAIEETMRRAEKEQEFLRRTLERRRREAQLPAQQPDHKDLEPQKQAEKRDQEG